MVLVLQHHVGSYLRISYIFGLFDKEIRRRTKNWNKYYQSETSWSWWRWKSICIQPPFNGTCFMVKYGWQDRFRHNFDHVQCSVLDCSSHRTFQIIRGYIFQYLIFNSGGTNTNVLQPQFFYVTCMYSHLKTKCHFNYKINI